MLISVLTLFPDMFTSPLQESILKRAIEQKHIEIEIIDIRTFCHDKHNTADDTPYGGGPGMVMKPEPIAEAIQSVIRPGIEPEIIYMTPKGQPYHQKAADSLSKKEHLILLCGHYEGIDQRIRDKYITCEISMGDYILTGGELPALMIIDSVARLVPGVLGNKASLDSESFNGYLLDHPQYTKPRIFEDMEVPEVLLSGNHALIEKWRLEKAEEETKRVRPELYDAYLPTKPVPKKKRRRKKKKPVE